MECYRLPGGRLLVVVEGDITKAAVDAIVNAANSLMIMGGGVAGAIKRAGGDEIEREALRYAPVPVGEAVATGAGKLKVKYVIHAPTMERPAMAIPLENAVKATRAALRKAVELGVKSVALPAMGAGVGGLPVKDVAREMAKVAMEEGPDIIVFVAYGSSAYREMIYGVREVLGEPTSCPADLRVFR
ncbi:MAG: macro domain-containing protein [Desulfurococcales archaeon]|nr:macro domain-containing protein [Desulfurococcales archaeon]